MPMKCTIFVQLWLVQLFSDHVTSHIVTAEVRTCISVSVFCVCFCVYVTLFVWLWLLLWVVFTMANELLVGPIPNPALFRDWSFNRFCSLVLVDRDTSIQWCQDVGLLSSRKQCPNCRLDMPICNTRAQGAGRVTCVGKAFRCQKAVYVGRARPHDVEISLARGTWFDKSKLPMELVLSLTYMMAHGESYEHIIREARTLDVDDPQHLSSETVADWYMYFREAVLESILDRFRTRGPIGGPGATVEIDEAKIGHRKYNRGRVVDGHWILGMIDRQTGEVRVEILPNNDRSAQAMLPLIQQHVLPGTTI